jgi:hypothetical protein
MAIFSSLQFLFIVRGGDEHPALQAPGFDEGRIDGGDGMPYGNMMKSHRGRAWQNASFCVMQDFPGSDIF